MDFFVSKTSKVFSIILKAEGKQQRKKELI